MTVQDRYSALRREYFARTGRMPTRLLWSKDVRDTAIEEERARIIELEARCGGGFELAMDIPLTVRSRWMEFVTDSALPEGTMIFDEGVAE